MSLASREHAKQYLTQHRIPQLFESLLSSLMMERPENPMEYIEKKMCQIRDLGVENVTWETLISHLHPYRNNIRRQYVRDGSVYDLEFTKLQGEIEEYRKLKREQFESMASTTNDFEDVADLDCVLEQQQSYEPNLFQLTEAHS
ncbi:adenylate kinase isoenzyme 5 [Plakobranchus ocellatus]|uniref:Adenylate kinase isoenzyme 5 n=1 Tax=Plakobranchus ocellatus TaxID=259542 RepID=A0AAV3YRP1_9GAST|nr:adenylate kinase isoenzyme 5 [Plakobranchus ocellatus]